MHRTKVRGGVAVPPGHDRPGGQGHCEDAAVAAEGAGHGALPDQQERGQLSALLPLRQHRGVLHLRAGGQPGARAGQAQNQG